MSACNLPKLQLVALQHLTAARAFMFSSGMPSFAAPAAFRPATILAPSRAHAGTGLGCITTATTLITGVRWIVFA